MRIRDALAATVHWGIVGFTIISLLGVALCQSSPAAARESGFQGTPDQRRVLVNKDVSSQRYAITLNLYDRTLTGNIFFTDGAAPQFIFCTPYLRAFHCHVADACTTNGRDSGIQQIPGGRGILVNKDVGTERYAIALNADGSLTGNVFFTSGEAPKFIFCQPSDGTAYSCSVADSCGDPGCPNFVDVGDVTLPADFFTAPPSCPNFGDVIDVTLPADFFSLPLSGALERPLVLTGVVNPPSLQQLFTVDLKTGLVTQVIDDGDVDNFEPSWSPDYRQIVFQRWDRGALTPNTLWVVNADGSGLRQLTSEVGAGDRNPSWSPDGKFIAFDRTLPDGQGQHIWRIDADGSNLRLLSEVGAAGDYMPSWSPDSANLVYQRDAEVWIMQADGSNKRRLVYDTLPGPGEFFFHSGGFSPDGQSIALVGSRQGSSVSQLYLADSDGSNVRLLTDALGRIAEVRWSPDGSQLAIVDDKFQGFLLIIGSDGLDLRVVPMPIYAAGFFGFDW